MSGPAKKRTHPHAHLMKLYAKDAAETDKPWERWEIGTGRGNKWLPAEYPLDWTASEYRRKPRTRIVNGFEVPEPLREVPENGDRIFVADPTLSDWFDWHIWNGHDQENKWLERGLIFDTEEAADANAKAMCGVQP